MIIDFKLPGIKLYSDLKVTQELPNGSDKTEESPEVRSLLTNTKTDNLLPEVVCSMKHC